jgi:hypothetical protein
VQNLGAQARGLGGGGEGLGGVQTRRLGMAINWQHMRSCDESQASQSESADRSGRVPWRSSGVAKVLIYVLCYRSQGVSGVIIDSRYLGIQSCEAWFSEEGFFFLPAE